MLHWVVLFLAIALVGGLLGFGGLVSAASGIAQALFLGFLLVFAVALVMGRLSRQGPPAI